MDDRWSRPGDRQRYPPPLNQTTHDGGCSLLMGLSDHDQCFQHLQESPKMKSFSPKTTTLLVLVGALVLLANSAFNPNRHSDVLLLATLLICSGMFRRASFG
jgi:hypothetical protein